MRTGHPNSKGFRRRFRRWRKEFKKLLPDWSDVIANISPYTYPYLTLLNEYMDSKAGIPKEYLSEKPMTAADMRLEENKIRNERYRMTLFDS